MKFLNAAFCFFVMFTCVHAGEYKSPYKLVPAKDGSVIYVLNRDANEVAVFDTAKNEIVKTYPVSTQPNSIALSQDGKYLAVASGAYAGKLEALNLETGKMDYSFNVGHTPCGLSVSADGKTAVVCNRFSNNVMIFDTTDAKKAPRTVAVVREPRASVITPDGKTAFVTNFLPNDASDSYDVAALVSAIDLASGEVKSIRLPNGSASIHDICVSPDGNYVYLTGILARYQMPTTQLERGWMNTNAVSILDAKKKEWINTVLLDDVDRGASNPWGIAISGDGKQLYVAISGAHELCVIDTEAMLEKLLKFPKTLEEAKAAGTYDDRGAASSTIAADVPNDLAFLVGMKKRIRLTGNGPRSVTSIGNKVYLGMYFSDSISIVDLSKRYPKAESVFIGTTKELSDVRKGEMYWNDATVCFQLWQSCASCHPDARMDAFNWDLLNDGIGTPKNAKSLLQSHLTPRAMWTGIRPNSAYAIRTGFRHILFSVPDEQICDEIDAWLHTLEPEKSPYLKDGKLSESAKRGEVLFKKLRCDVCHPAPLYTDLKVHNVKTGTVIDQGVTDFDTPSLIETWRTAPYLHDGRYVKMRDVYAEGKHGDVLVDMDALSEQEINDLSEYVLSL